MILSESVDVARDDLQRVHRFFWSSYRRYVMRVHTLRSTSGIHHGTSHALLVAHAPRFHFAVDKSKKNVNLTTSKVKKKNVNLTIDPLTSCSVMYATWLRIHRGNFLCGIQIWPSFWHGGTDFRTYRVRKHRLIRKTTRLNDVDPNFHISILFFT